MNFKWATSPVLILTVIQRGTHCLQHWGKLVNEMLAYFEPKWYTLQAKLKFSHFNVI